MAATNPLKGSRKEWPFSLWAEPPARFAEAAQGSERRRARPEDLFLSRPPLMASTQRTTEPLTPEGVKKFDRPLTRPCGSLSSFHPSRPAGAKELTLVFFNFFIASSPRRGVRKRDC
jgi:hypothetical protein